MSVLKIAEKERDSYFVIVALSAGNSAIHQRLAVRALLINI